MSEIVYSKRQIDPLIKKFSINPETNECFATLITTFKGMPAYQIWAIKLAFEQNVPTKDIVAIKAWSDNHSNLISKLEKHNLVAYKTKDDIAQLNTEIDAWNKINFVKNCINSFNTKQKTMLSEAIHINGINPLNLSKNTIFNSWYNLFSKFEKLPFNRKSKFISLYSAADEVGIIKEGLEGAIKQSYAWNRDDMMAFKDNNANNCDVIYDKDNIVVLHVPNFASSKLLCGGGRTGWCITRESRYFENYVTDHTPNRDQFFLFNFNKPESDELAHIGFTVDKRTGICNAHSTKNSLLIGGSKITYHGKQIDIYDVFEALKINISTFVHIEKNSNYSWNKESLLSYLNDNFPIVYENGNKIILKAESKSLLNNIIDHTKIALDSIYLDKDHKCYVFFNFDAPYNEDNSILCFWTKIDDYGLECLKSTKNIFGRDVNGNGVLASIGITTHDFISDKEIKPELLLHKYVNNDDVEGAINLIKNNPEMDVNYALKGLVPISIVINKGMLDVFKAIVNAKSFNANINDGFGEPLLTSMIYTYAACIGSDDRTRNSLKKMIKYILSDENFDVNQQDINYDTPINVAIQENSTMWIAEALVANPLVKINVINDYNRSALGNAIANRNIDGIRLLGTRNDLIVREEDIQLAKKNGISLDRLIDLKEKNIQKAGTSTPANGDSLAYSELLKMVMATITD